MQLDLEIIEINRLKFAQRYQGQNRSSIGLVEWFKFTCEVQWKNLSEKIIYFLQSNWNVKFSNNSEQAMRIIIYMYKLMITYTTWLMPWKVNGNYFILSCFVGFNSAYRSNCTSDIPIATMIITFDKNCLSYIFWNFRVISVLSRIIHDIAARIWHRESDFYGCDEKNMNKRHIFHNLCHNVRFLDFSLRLHSLDHRLPLSLFLFAARDAIRDTGSIIIGRVSQFSQRSADITRKGDLVIVPFLVFPPSSLKSNT